MRKLLTLLGVALTIVAVSMFNAASYAQEGTKAVSEEELVPAKDALEVKYVPVAPCSAKACCATKVSGLIKGSGASALSIALTQQDKAFPGGGGSVGSVSVSAVHDGKNIYFLLEWPDATNDSAVLTGTSFRDAASLMFPVGNYAVIDVAHPFSPRMGDRGKPVNLWHWKADWEADLKSPGRLADSGAVYPAKHDDYMSDTYHLAIRDNQFNTAARVSGGVAACNPLSQAHKSSVEDLNAIGFGTLTTQVNQNVKGNGVHKDGSWSVVIVRSLTTSDPNDTQFVAGGETVFNVAVWNGSDGDKDGQKSISLSWHPIKLERVSY